MQFCNCMRHSGSSSYLGSLVTNCFFFFFVTGFLIWYCCDWSHKRTLSLILCLQNFRVQIFLYEMDVLCWSPVWFASTMIHLMSLLNDFIKEDNLGHCVCILNVITFQHYLLKSLSIMVGKQWVKNLLKYENETIYVLRFRNWYVYMYFSAFLKCFKIMLKDKMNI